MADGPGDTPRPVGPAIPGVDDLTEVGRGGFGVVYRGHQADLGRDVAVKVITSPGTSGSSVEAWRREVTAMGRLSNHPNIVAVFSVGVTDDGSPYLVMPYVPGGSLKDRLRRDGPLPAEEVAALGVKLAGALATAHAAGVLHRDVKPDNVLLSPYGEPQLTDFGIARLVDATVTATRTVHATIPYAAPEVLSGHRATESADVYGLGATLFACLTGEPPFPSQADESLVSLVGRIAGSPPPDLRERGVPDALASVVERALAKTPAERVPSAEELRSRLAAAGAGLTGAGVDTASFVAAVEGDDATAVSSTTDAPGAGEATAVSPAAADATAVASAVGPPGPPSSVLPGPGRAEAATPPSPARRGPVLAVLALLLVVGLAATAWALGGGDDGDGGDDGEAAATSTTAADDATTSTETTETTEAPTTTTQAPTTAAPPTTTTAPPTTTTEAPAPAPPAGGGPAAAAVAYVEALAAGDTGRAYAMLSDDFRNRSQTPANFDRYWGPREVSRAGEPRVEGDTVVVPIVDNGTRRDFRLRMVEEGGRWAVDGPRPSS